MRSLNELFGGHLLHLVLLTPAALFGLGVLFFSRRRPAWDEPVGGAGVTSDPSELPELSVLPAPEDHRP